jgi:hypothetical protein
MSVVGASYAFFYSYSYSRHTTSVYSRVRPSCLVLQRLLVRRWCPAVLLLLFCFFALLFLLLFLLLLLWLWWWWCRVRYRSVTVRVLCVTVRGVLCHWDGERMKCCGERMRGK